ncbi:MAG TPA: tetratricopeptide repeat protein [Pyrinomonadaceae bacterium]|nr:tetratricopeptide repeat protein [Pyrinomonadaceae bacterium]
MNNSGLQSVTATFSRRLFVLILASISLVLSAVAIRAQGAIDYTGTGGRHSIEGRIYFPSGRKADDPGVKISLETSASGTLTVFSDFNGTFSFRNLSAGSYTVVIPGTDLYDAVREPVFIDDPGSSSIRTSNISVATPRAIILPIYLLPKRTKPSAKASVVDANLANLPKAATDNYYKALESIRLNNSKEAIAELEAAVNAYPQFPRALNELGVQYLKTGQVQKAVLTLSTVVRLTPDEVVPRLNYGIALLENNNFNEAETQLRLVLQKNDNAATAHMYLGIALVRKRTARAEDNARYLEAERELQRAVTLGGDQIVQAHYFLAGIYWRNGNYRRAADELETYLKLAPNAPDADKTRTTIRELRAKA